MIYSLDIINLAIKYLIQNINKNKIANMLNVTRQTIHTWSIKYKHNIIKNSPVSADQIKKNRIHKNNKIDGYLNDIELYVSNNIGCSLEDINIHLNKCISKSSICNALKKLKITRKK